MFWIKEVNSTEEFEQAFQIRMEVFVKEQGVPADREADEYDAVAHHLLVLDGNTAVATGRWREVEGMAKLERLCVYQDYRGRGVGKMLIKGMEERARIAGLRTAKLHGQTHAQDFYTKLGYQAASEPFMEEGIEHLLMVKDLNRE